MFRIHERSLGIGIFVCLVAVWIGCATISTPSRTAAPVTVEQLIDAGNALVTEADYESAISLYNRALAMDITAAEAHGNLSVAYYYLGRQDEAIREAQQAIVMAPTELTTDMPEHADLNDVWPGTDWDTRARGLGATPDRPLTSVGEENLLHLPGDPYDGESILVHEFAHTWFEMGLVTVYGEPATWWVLEDLYNDALAAGTWADTYAMTNAQEYWAEAVQSWYDTNIERIQPDGIHGPINTRAELAASDPAMADFISTFLPKTPLDIP